MYRYCCPTSHRLKGRHLEQVHLKVWGRTSLGFLRHSKHVNQVSYKKVYNLLLGWSKVANFLFLHHFHHSRADPLPTARVGKESTRAETTSVARATYFLKVKGQLRQTLNEYIIDMIGGGKNVNQFPVANFHTL